MTADVGFMALLSEADRVLVREATDAVRARYRYGRHTVGAALRGGSGRVYVAVNLDATVGRAAVCAEAIVLGAAVMAGEAGIEAVVAVRQQRADETAEGATDAHGAATVAIVSPCGLCRELLLDHAPEVKVITPGRGPVTLAELLPVPYRR